MRKRRLVAAVLAAVMGMSLVACGNTGAGTESTEVVTEAVETASDATAQEAEATAKETAEEDNSLHDGDAIIDINFDDAGTGKFGSYMNGGSCAIANAGGELAITIGDVGDLNYANQAFYDGFELVEGVTYTYSFDIHCDIERDIEYRLQMNGGDYHAYLGDNLSIGPDVTNFSVDFTMTEPSDPAPRLVFNMGRFDNMPDTVEEHKIYLDNVKLVVKSAGDAVAVEALPEAPNVTTSQIGYGLDDVKEVFAKGDNESTFDVMDARTNKSVYSGTFGNVIDDQGLDGHMKQGDFSDFKDAGTYYIQTPSGEKTYEFTIGDGVLEDAYADAVKMLYLQRCGTETTEDIAGDFAHGVCHDTEATVYGTNKKMDVSGGWHDAGDYGRYVVPGAKTVQDLFLAYEDYHEERDDLGIPESGNGIPDVLDEARWELDWMLKMQDASGGVYHKVTCANFPETVGPVDETDELIVCPISTTATGDFAAVMAKAAVLYNEMDPDFAATARAAAKKAYDYCKDLDDNDGFKNPEDIATGEYQDWQTNDEVFFAATELLLAGETDESIVSKVEAGLGLANGTAVADAKPKYACEFGWQAMAGYAYYDLAKYDGLIEGADKFADYQEVAKAKILSAADKVVNKAASSGYHMTFEDSYYWGSNMGIADNGMKLLMANTLSADDKYTKLAGQQLNYLLGANPLGYCFVTGYGTVSPENPHHRPSQVLGKAMPGMLVGGADSNLEDPYAKAVLADQAPAMCYADNSQSYSTNEVTIYWNSPLIYLLSAEK